MIRWSLQRGFVCIPKSNNEKRIAENADVFDFHISDEDMQKLVCRTSYVKAKCLAIEYLFPNTQNGLDEHFITDWPGIMTTPWEP